MSEVFTNRPGSKVASHPGERGGKPDLSATPSERLAEASWTCHRGEPDRGNTVRHDGAPLEPPRIRIDVPLGTSYLAIQASIFRQVYQLAGTQLRAAIALGITPDTISRVLRRCDRLGISSPKLPEAWPGIETNRSIGLSAHPAIEKGDDEPASEAADRWNDEPMDRWTDEPIAFSKSSLARA